MFRVRVGDAWPARANLAAKRQQQDTAPATKSKTPVKAAAKPAAPATVTLKHLAAGLAGRYGMEKKPAEAVFTDVFEILVAHLKSGDRVRIGGPGILEVKDRPGRMGHNPATGDYIRRELGQFFSTLPSVADSFQIRTWRGGPQAGQPKVPLVAKGLLKRGLMRLQPTPWPPRLFFTEAGLAALRAMTANAHLANPKTFAHVRQELGIDPRPEEPEPG